MTAPEPTDPRVSTDPDRVAAVPSVVTIGMFDGVHRGHQRIIGRAVRQAREGGLRSVVVTFDRHPAEVIRPGQQPRYLMTRDGRVEALLDCGVDLVLVLAFTPELASRSPDDFVATLLAGPLQAVAVVVGANFRFGHQAAGDVAALGRLGRRFGFTVDAVDLHAHAQTAISSTAIREHLAAGELAWATDALGRHHVVEGTVVAGDGRGATIGVPTANLDVDPAMQIPAAGVYAGYAGVAGAELTSARAVVNIGTRPTFHVDGARTIEAHLLDYPPRRADGTPVSGGLQGEVLAVAFAHRLRDERGFDGVDALVTQIEADIARARDLL